MNSIVKLLDNIDSVMYYPVLIIVMAIVGVYFTVRTRGVQLRLFGEALRVIREKPDDKNHVSSLQAMLVSTASRVGTGNIVGVSTAICLGGAGAVFWMWVMCIVATSSAFIESTLAQIYKRKNSDGSSYRISANAKKNGVAYGQFVEFDPRINKAFLYPALDENRGRIRENVKTAVQNALRRGR